MRKLFWISVIVTLVTVFLSNAKIAAADGAPEGEAAAARAFCVDFLAGKDEETSARMDAAMRDALGADGAAQVRDSLSSTLGDVKEIGEAWFTDAIEGYRRYRVPVEFENGKRDLLIVYTAEGRVGGLFTRSHLERVDPEPVSASDARTAGTWAGTLDIPGSPLDIQVTLVAGEQGWSGSIDIPAQGLLEHPLERIRVEGDTVTFRLVAIPGEPTMTGKLAGDQLTGALSQSGSLIAFALERSEKKALQRPQTPQPPFDYGQQDVSYRNGDIALAGTLTIPAGPGPFPAVVLISGSGAQDRNEEIFGHKPFLVLADHLTRAGIAVLRVDDRGVGGSDGNISESTSSDFAEDVLAGVRFLAARPDIDAKRIGLIGHSEGGIVAPLAASRSDGVAFIVLLAGTGVPGSEVMELQLQLHMRSLGLEEGTIEASAKESRELYRLLREGATNAAVSEQLGRLKIAQGDPTPVGPEDLARMTSTWMRYFIEYDPRPALAKVRVPVLALNGELDLQVDAAQNLEAIRKALAHNPDVTARRLPQLNHLFQTAKTGAFGEYASIEETLAPAMLDLVRDWIVERSAIAD